MVTAALWRISTCMKVLHFRIDFMKFRINCCTSSERSFSNFVSTGIASRIKNFVGHASPWKVSVDRDLATDATTVPIALIVGGKFDIKPLFSIKYLAQEVQGAQKIVGTNFSILEAAKQANYEYIFWGFIFLVVKCDDGDGNRCATYRYCKVLQRPTELNTRKKML